MLKELQIIEQESFFGQAMVPSVREPEQINDRTDDEDDDDNDCIAQAAVEDERVRKLKNECKYFHIHLLKRIISKSISRNEGLCLW